MISRRKFLKGLLVGVTALAVPIDALAQLLPEPIRPPRMLKCTYSMESAEKLRTRHGIDFEKEMVSMLQKEIAEDIDKQILMNINKRW